MRITINKTIAITSITITTTVTSITITIMRREALEMRSWDKQTGSKMITITIIIH